jgi:hypothetical protein
MKKTRLESEHIFLQFLMMFLTLVFVFLFSHFVEDLFWFNNSLIYIPLMSGVVCIFLSVISVLRFARRKEKGEKTFLLTAIFFLLLAFLTIFSTLTRSISFSSQIYMSFLTIFFLLGLLLFLLIKKNWYYSNLDFWTIFSLSLFLFSRIFFLQAVLKDTSGIEEYSQLIVLFGYLTLSVGFVNDLYEVGKRKKKINKKK